jgi:hypothetical protein
MVGITTEALEIYRVAHLRCPHLSIQAFVKTICDLHGVRPSLIYSFYSVLNTCRLTFTDTYHASFQSRSTSTSKLDGAQTQ